MEVEREPVKLNLNHELIQEARSLSMEAHKHKLRHHYITNGKKHGTSSLSSSMGVLIIAFQETWKTDDWYDDNLFGETDVDRSMFPSLQRVGVDQVAKVNAMFLRRFQNLLKESQFETEVNKAMVDKKKILLTGHSSGGAIATFATLWILEKSAKKQRIEAPITCVTFGSPLVGDRTLSHAIRRQKWADYFTHFVTEHDIVPRIMLAPKTSIQEHLPSILKFLEQKVNPGSHKSYKSPRIFDKMTKKRTVDNTYSIESHRAVAFFENVMFSASAVASHNEFDLMEPTSSLKQKLLGDFVKVSPYRPFGTYIFLTRTDGAGLSPGLVSPRAGLVVENPDAVLQLLFYFCQLTDEDQNLADFALKSLSESLSYEENGLGWQNLVNLKDLNEHLLTPNGTAGDAVRTSNKALSELSARGRLCLLAAEEAETRKKKNEKRIDGLIQKLRSDQKRPKENRIEQKSIKEILDEIRVYKENHAKGKMGYYDAFKLQDDEKDFTANINRLELAKIFDEIVEMLIREDLPDEFEGRKEWVDLGTEFRRLVEPLDIANYYRHLKGEGYMDVRPKRYKFTQRWYDHANGDGFRFSESNFMAEVEEIKKHVEKHGDESFEKVKERVENIEKQVLKWVFEEDILGNDVFLEESTLSECWKKLPYDHRIQSVLRHKFNTS